MVLHAGNELHYFDRHVDSRDLAGLNVAQVVNRIAVELVNCLFHLKHSRKFKNHNFDE